MKNLFAAAGGKKDPEPGYPLESGSRETAGDSLAPLPVQDCRLACRHE
jgi:hypothetical protein